MSNDTKAERAKHLRQMADAAVDAKQELFPVTPAFLREVADALDAPASPPPADAGMEKAARELAVSLFGIGQWGEPLANQGELHRILVALRAAVRQAVEAEREACAKICDEQQANEPECPERASYCAEAIRARTPKEQL